MINYSIAYPNKSIVLTSDTMNNTPVSRLTYTVLDQDGVNVKFEMSQDGGTFLRYTEARCRKVK